MRKIDARLFEYTAELNINDNITLISGDSGIGKTLLFNYFDRQSYNNPKIKCYNAKFIDKLKNGNETTESVVLRQIKELSNCLIIIDNAEVLLGDSVRQHIVFDGKNKYMIFGRNVSGLWLTENNIASLERDDDKKKIYLNYIYKDVNRK